MRHLMEKRKTNPFRWQTLKEALVERRSKLGESQSLQSVSRDADDIEAWIAKSYKQRKMNRTRTLQIFRYITSFKIIVI